MNGLLRDEVNPSDVPGVCNTGNCTWGDYQSMGVYSTITDVSSTIIISECRKQKTRFLQPGCDYSVPAIDKDPTARKTPLQTHKYGQTLWIGASNPLNYDPPPRC